MNQPLGLLDDTGEPGGAGPSDRGFKGELRYFVRFCRTNRMFTVGLGIVFTACLAALLSPYILPYDPVASNRGMTLTPPSSTHWMGTDELGMDIFSRVVAATRIDLYIALVSTAIALALGIPLGVLSGALRGRASLISEIILRLMDVLQSFPVFILALALVAALGPRAENVIIALAVLQFPVMLRLTRSAAIVNREALFVEAARASGTSWGGIAFRHVMPNSLAPPLIAASVAVAQAILITAGLSFVGAGVRPPAPEWGAMISLGAQNMITGQWWPSLFPGLALGITVLGFALVGDGLRDYLDPKSRGGA